MDKKLYTPKIQIHNINNIYLIMVIRSHGYMYMLYSVILLLGQSPLWKPNWINRRVWSPNILGANGQNADKEGRLSRPSFSELSPTYIGARVTPTSHNCRLQFRNYQNGASTIKEHGLNGEARSNPLHSTSLSLYLFLCVLWLLLRFIFVIKALTPNL